MKIKCYNPKCLYERNYKGKFTDDKDMITCTKCRYKLRLGKAKIKDNESDEVSEVDVPPTQSHEVSIKNKQKSEVTSSYRKEIKAPETEHFEYPEMKGQHLPTHIKPKRRVRVIKDNFTVKVIENNLDLKVIPRDPLTVLKKNDPRWQ